VLNIYTRLYTAAFNLFYSLHVFFCLIVCASLLIFYGFTLTRGDYINIETYKHTYFFFFYVSRTTHVSLFLFNLRELINFAFYNLHLVNYSIFRSTLLQVFFLTKHLSVFFIFTPGLFGLFFSLLAFLLYLFIERVFLHLIKGCANAIFRSPVLDRNCCVFSRHITFTVNAHFMH